MKLTVSNVKREIMGILKKNEVKKAALFGSVVTGEATDKSDIDILIEFNGRKSLLDLVGLEQELEEKLGRKVDVITYKSVHPLLRKSIFEHQVQIL